LKDRPVIFHPFLIAIFPAISLVADHPGYFFLNSKIVELAAITLVLTVLLFWLLTMSGIDWQRAGIIVTTALLIFFSYGHIYEFLTVSLGLGFIRHRLLILLMSLVVLAIFYILRIAKINLSTITYALNIMGAALVVFSFVQIASYGLSTTVEWEPPHDLEVTGRDSENPMDFPDIYYIILDSYASSSSLEEYYGFDNHEFINQLQDRGFFVAEESFSNYAMTNLSLPSSLNMDYLDALSPAFTEAHLDKELSRQMIENNKVMSFLRSKGFILYFFGSGQGVTERNNYVDHDIRCGFLDGTVYEFIRSTLILPVIDQLNFYDDQERKRRLCVFEQIAEIPALEGPKFIFAHIPSPHTPFLFDADGDPIREYNKKDEKQYYINQMIFINGKVVEMVDHIIRGSKNDPVILIQADHGPLPTQDGQSIDHLTQDYYRQRMRILNAYYLPQDGIEQLYSSISPVNSFRLVFNILFQTNLPLLDDFSYYSPLDNPLQMIDVTEGVRHD
jgi:hypothetical protein